MKQCSLLILYSQHLVHVFTCHSCRTHPICRNLSTLCASPLCAWIVTGLCKRPAGKFWNLRGRFGPACYADVHQICLCKNKKYAYIYICIYIYLYTHIYIYIYIYIDMYAYVQQYTDITTKCPCAFHWSGRHLYLSMIRLLRSRFYPTNSTLLFRQRIWSFVLIIYIWEICICIYIIIYIYICIYRFIVFIYIYVYLHT